MRKIIAAMLAVVLLLQTGFLLNEPQKAYAATTKAEKVIQALGFMKTDQGEISADTVKITRAQFAQLLVNLSGRKDSVASTINLSLFKDVSRKYWAAPYIRAAVENGWMTGYISGAFKPDNSVTLSEAVNGVLKLLGYSDSDFSGNITGEKMALYQSKKLNKNVTVSGKASYLSYDNCVNLFYNVLNSTTKEGINYASALGYSLDSSGEVDYMSLVDTGIEGPVIADSSWTSDIPFSVQTATFYKNDAKCSYTDVDKYDVLYYSESFETVWAYDTKVTGTLSVIAPDLISPASVTVAGAEYTFETSAAALEFSSTGAIEKGDIVTLLLGKNGTVAGVLTLDEYNTTVTGLVLSTGTHLVLNSSGNYVSTGYVTYVDASGNVYTQDHNSTNDEFLEESLVRITYKDGTATVSHYIQPGLGFSNAQFSNDGTSVGTFELAADVKILDYSDGAYSNVYPARLAGMILLNSAVIYCGYNVNGEIEELILSDATGDLDQYGIYTGLTLSGASASYTYIIDGVARNLSTSSLDNLSLTEGPMGFHFEGSTLESATALTGVSVSDIGTLTVTSGTTKYTLAEKLGVYVLSNGEYVQTTLSKISDLTKYKATAYYDKAATLGGRIRIIVAEPIS